MMLIFVIALIVVGPRRLPEIGRNLGKIINDLKQMSQEFTAEMTQELNAPAKENEAKENIDQSVKENETREVADQSVKENETKEVADQSVSEKAANGDRG